MKKITALLLAILMLLSLLSCQKKESEVLGALLLDGEELHPGTVLTIGGENISFEEFRYYYLNYRDMYLAEDAEYFSDPAKEEALKEEIVRGLCDNYAVKALAEQYKVKLSRSEKDAVQSDIDTTVTFYGGTEEFTKQLNDSYMSLSLYRSMMEYSSLYLKLFDRLFEDGGEYAWSDEEFFSYYRENYVAVQEIFIAYRNGENEANHPETLAAITEVQEKAKAGEDFWTLIELYGEDEGMESNPDGYYFTEGEAEKVLFDASKALEVGAVSEPVAGASGLYLIKRIPMTETKMDKNRETALRGYTDSVGEWHSGAYDEVFAEIYTKKAQSLEISYSEYWDKISTQTVK